MKPLIFFIVLFLSANGYPVKQQREQGSEVSKMTKKEKLNNTVVIRRSCKFGAHFVGSNLFSAFPKTCFSYDEANLLMARREFEQMIPRDLPVDLLHDKAVADIMRYFYYGLWLLRRIDDSKTRRTMEKAFYDTLGGFLAHYLVPVVKFSFYANKVHSKTVRNVLTLYQKCRRFLNTNGNGWRKPIKDPIAEFGFVEIEPLEFVDDYSLSDEDKKYCTDLDLNTAQLGTEIVDDGLIVALPKLELEDPDGFLGNAWLPFSRKRTYNLQSFRSAFIFVKYYRSVSSCYQQKNLQQKPFDQKFRQWIVQNVRCHLGDEMFYPGLGGILNIYEALIAAYSHDKRNVNEKNYKEKANKIDDVGPLLTENSTELADNTESADSSQRKRAMDKKENSEHINNQIQSIGESVLQQDPCQKEGICVTRVYPSLKPTKSKTTKTLTTNFPIFIKNLKTTVKTSKTTQVLPIFSISTTKNPIHYPTFTRPCQGGKVKSNTKETKTKAGSNNIPASKINYSQLENKSEKRQWYIGYAVCCIVMLTLSLCWICSIYCGKFFNKIHYIAVFRKDKTKESQSAAKGSSKSNKDNQSSYSSEESEKHGCCIRRKKGDKKRTIGSHKIKSRKSEKTHKKTYKEGEWIDSTAKSHKKGDNQKPSARSEKAHDKTKKPAKDNKHVAKEAEKAGKGAKKGGKGTEKAEKEAKKGGKGGDKAGKRADEAGKEAEKVAKKAEKSKTPFSSPRSRARSKSRSQSRESSC